MTPGNQEPCRISLKKTNRVNIATGGDTSSIRVLQTHHTRLLHPLLERPTDPHIRRVVQVGGGAHLPTKFVDTNTNRVGQDIEESVDRHAPHFAVRKVRTRHRQCHHQGSDLRGR